MIEIIFQKKQDAWSFYQHLIARLKILAETNTILLNEDRNRVYIPHPLYDGEYLTEIKKSFYDFITVTKRDEWFRSILAESYYFTEWDEQDQIMDIIYSVLEGERKELASFMEGLKVNVQVREAISSIFDERITFSYDSFLTFRLKFYVDQLAQWVEIAIDEYKMEQEYQMFVHTLRDFLAGRKPQMSHLHLVIDEAMTFYSCYFTEMKRSELFKAIDRKLLVNHPVYVDSWTIAPLLSIAPLAIYLYTDDPEQPLVRTILNIFEERVKLSPISAFQMEKMNFLSEDSENIR